MGSHEAYEAEFEHVGEQRRGDRRRSDRRTPRPRLDALFAATLISQVERASGSPRGRYPGERRLRVGVVLNVKA